MCASLEVSQGSDGACMKARMLWLRSDLGGLQGSFPLGWTTLVILYCPVFSIKTLCGVVNRWGSGSSGREVVWK